MNASDVTDALKLSVYLGERDRVGRELLADVLLARFGAHRVHAGMLLRGSAGFGAHHRLHTDRLLTLSEDLPMVAEAVDHPSRIEALLADVLALPRRGLVTLERARLLSARDPVAGSQTETVEGVIKVTLYLGRKLRIGDEPAFVVVTRALCAAGAEATIVLLGVDGTRDGERQRASFFGRNAEVPLAVTAVGARTRIATALQALGPVAGAVVTVERVELCKLDGVLIAPPATVPERDADGRTLWQKLTVYTSEEARHHGRPLHQAIVGRLRASDAGGATTLRGIWGFHGARAPHGDRLFSLRRHVPVMTVVIDAPERIAAAFAIIDRLTGTEGMVTSERVPAAGGAGVARDDLRLGRFGR